MTTPRDRVAFGFHAFPFYGMARRDHGLPSVPFLPLRLRVGGGAWSNPMNAVLDTGSTHSYMPKEVAEELGIEGEGAEVERRGAGGTFPSLPARCDVAVVDAHFPTVTCWELAEFEMWIPTRRDSLEVPIVGWDLLHLFEVSLLHHADLIRMRLAPHDGAVRRVRTQ